MAVGFASFLPAWPGALPWIASKTAPSEADIATRSHAEAADHAGHQVADDVSSYRFGITRTSYFLAATA